MDMTLVAFILAFALFLGMPPCIEVGRRAGLSNLARGHEGLEKGIGASEGAIFGLLGLLIAFTFSGAAARFEDRRNLIREEANNIGTAYLRIGLFGADAQPPMRELFRRYLDLRLSAHLYPGEMKVTGLSFAESNSLASSSITESNVLQNQIWETAMSASHKPGASGSVPILLLPALNAMIDITTTQAMATKNHPPLPVFLLLPMLSLIGSLLVGYDSSSNKRRRWLHSMAFAAVMSLTVYVIIDLEFPRLGLIRITTADQVLIDLRKSMH